jgi:hypothetical protein
MEVQMTVEVREHHSKPTKVNVVLWSGDAEEGLALKNAGWISGMETGYSKDTSGDSVLRALCDSKQGTVVAFPGDYIVQAEDGETWPVDPEVFEQRYDKGKKVKGLETEEAPPTLDSAEPTQPGPETHGAEEAEPEPMPDMYPGFDDTKASERRAAAVAAAAEGEAEAAAAQHSMEIDEVEDELGDAEEPEGDEEEDEEVEDEEEDEEEDEDEE